MDAGPGGEDGAPRDRARRYRAPATHERGDEQAVDQRLDEPQERQVEQEERDVPAEDRVGDGRAVGIERDACCQRRIVSHGRPPTPRDAERDEDRERPMTCAASGTRSGISSGSNDRPCGRPRRADPAAAERARPPPGRVGVGAASFRPVDQPARSCRRARPAAGGRQPAGQPEVAEQDDERDQRARRGTARLDPEAGPEHRVEADAAVPDRVGPEVEPDDER